MYLVCGLVLGAVLVNAISQDPGYLLVTWGDWQVETSVWLALSALLLALVLLWVTLRALAATLRVPRALRRWLGWLDKVRTVMAEARALVTRICCL